MLYEDFFNAIEKNNIDFIIDNIDRINVNQKDDLGYSLLHKAVYFGNCEIINLLLDHNADIDVVDEYGETPLHSIIDNKKGNWYDSIELLLTRGANVNTANRLGESPLITAVISEVWINVIELLIKHGANVNFQDNEGDNAIRYAHDRSLNDVFKLLEKHGAVYDEQLTTNELMMREYAQGIIESYRFREKRNKMNINFNSVEDLRKFGFDGFMQVQKLRHDIALVPQEQGVYLILNQEENVTFLKEGVGGFFQGNDPNIPVQTLEDNWIEDALVVYIGKANNLRTRINQYMNFGRGMAAPHRGGRYIWQIEHHEKLLVCWKTLPNSVDPREIERQLITEFRQQYNNRRPFANLQG